MNRLKGKTCLVTAAGQGIGRASALAMAREGARVFATDINEDALSLLKNEGVETLHLDVRDPNSIKNVASQIGAPHVLFNCAGFVANGTVLDCDEDQWAFSLDINMTAMYRMLRAFLPPMIENGGGSIINTSSLAGKRGGPGLTAYSASKGAVIAFTTALAMELASDNIRVNAICPGWVETKMATGLHEGMANASGGDYDALYQQSMRGNMLGALLTPDTIGDMAVYLASERGRFITAQTLHICGGDTPGR